MSSEMRFYATRDDWVTLLCCMERNIEIHYMRSGACPLGQIPARYESCLEIPNLGFSTTPSSISSATYIICNKRLLLTPRQVGSGEHRRLTYDQLENPETVTFTPGGIWGNKVLIFGRIATVSNSLFSQSFFKIIKKIVRKEYKKAQSYWVGPNARRLYLSGYRLTIAEQTPPKFDLKIDQQES